ncbi:MAG: efflux transporter periplasmic adaptor subunit [Thiothrix sp.]|nr:MAG: efflux transporter periplasmic adaptor subunit [Thiothrix sp.]
MRILLFIVVGLFATLVNAEESLPLPFDVGQVTSESVVRERVLDGTVGAVNQTTVSSQTSGVVQAIEFDVDDFVNEGDIIVRLNETQQKAGFSQAKASQEEAEAKLKEAEQEYKRVKGIFKRKLVAKAEMDKATATLKSATARLASARANTVRAQEQLDHTLIRAPYSGLVTRRLIELGAFVNVGQALMGGVSLDRLRVNVDVPQRLINRIRTNNKARLMLDGPEFKTVPVGRITFFPFADPTTNTFKVRIDLKDKVENLFPGMFVKVAFSTGVSEHLVVPEAAVAYRGEVTGVYVIDAQGRPHFRHIRLGRYTGDNKRVILAGLSIDEKIALDPIGAGIYLKQSVEAAKEVQHDG